MKVINLEVNGLEQEIYGTIRVDGYDIEVSTTFNSEAELCDNEFNDVNSGDTYDIPTELVDKITTQIKELFNKDYNLNL